MKGREATFSSKMGCTPTESHTGFTKFAFNAENSPELLFIKTEIHAYYQ